MQARYQNSPRTQFLRQRCQELGAMFVTFFWSPPTAQELNIASHVLLQNDRYIFKACIFFLSINMVWKSSVIKLSENNIVCQGFYLTSRLETVRTRSGHLGWDATLTQLLAKSNVFPHLSQPLPPPTPPSLGFLFGGQVRAKMALVIYWMIK